MAAPMQNLNNGGEGAVRERVDIVVPDHKFHRYGSSLIPITDILLEMGIVDQKEVLAKHKDLDVQIRARNQISRRDIFFLTDRQSLWRTLFKREEIKNSRLCNWNMDPCTTLAVLTLLYTEVCCYICCDKCLIETYFIAKDFMNARISRLFEGAIMHGFVQAYFNERIILMQESKFHGIHGFQLMSSQLDDLTFMTFNMVDMIYRPQLKTGLHVINGHAFFVYSLKRTSPTYITFEAATFNGDAVVGFPFFLKEMSDRTRRLAPAALRIAQQDTQCCIKYFTDFTEERFLDKQREISNLRVNRYDSYRNPVRPTEVEDLISIRGPVAAVEQCVRNLSFEKGLSEPIYFWISNCNVAQFASLWSSMLCLQIDLHGFRVFCQGSLEDISRLLTRMVEGDDDDLYPKAQRQVYEVLP